MFLTKLFLKSSFIKSFEWHLINFMFCYLNSYPQVFFLENDEQHNGLSDPADHSRLTENVAKAFCLALCPHLKLLKEDGMTKLGLRVTLDSDQVSLE